MKKTLIEHYEEMNFQELNEVEKTLIYRKLNKIKVGELNKILEGGELVDKNELSQCENEMEEFKINDDNYKICVRKIKKTKEEIYYIINFYLYSANCSILQMDLKKKKVHLTELLKQQGCLMKKKGNKYEDNPKEGGEILMEIIIKICEKLKIKEITLTDDSYILCANNTNARINLVYSKMLLDGETWYGKFGFVPVEELNKKIYKENQENYNSNKLTKNIKKEKFIKEIIDKEKNEEEIKKILEKYEEMREEKLCLFMKWISENYCSIYSEIYEYIYKKAGYKKYSSLYFVLKLNTDLSEFVKSVKNGIL